MTDLFPQTAAHIRAHGPQAAEAAGGCRLRPRPGRRCLPPAEGSGGARLPEGPRPDGRRGRRHRHDGGARRWTIVGAAQGRDGCPGCRRDRLPGGERPRELAAVARSAGGAGHRHRAMPDRDARDCRHRWDRSSRSRSTAARPTSSACTKGGRISATSVPATASATTAAATSSSRGARTTGRTARSWASRSRRTLTSHCGPTSRPRCWPPASPTTESPRSRPRAPRTPPRRRPGARPHPRGHLCVWPADLSSSSRRMSNQGGGIKELRLAVVCYGGSSLAIYMHGVTKELHRLVKASALLEAELGPDPGAPTEAVYLDLLREVAKENGVRTRVVVDVVAGTSAGGINGIYLTKAIAHNLSQDALRDLWFERGDMSQLLLLPTWLPVKLRFFLLLPRALKKSPLRGGAMARWLHEALEGMDDGGSEPDAIETLVPEDGRLDLFVTITDFYGYDRQVPIFDPHLVHDSRHRHALAFTYRKGERDQFQRENNGSLAFAARTTSCFPGVFPPVSISAFREWVPDAKLDDLGRCFRGYGLAGAVPENTHFVDGGILDNKPFGWAIDAIKLRRADVEVERRLLYLEPDPGERFVPVGGTVPAPKKAPATLAAILGAVSGIPRHEPILDDLLDVRAHNGRVKRIRDVIETSFEGVAEFVGGVVGSADGVPDDAQSTKLAEWSAAINERTVAEAGLAYATYLRLKISGTVDRYADTVCNVCDFPDDSNHAQLVRSVLRCLADKRKLFSQQPEPTELQLAFLRHFDLGYHERRLRFVTSEIG